MTIVPGMDWPGETHESALARSGEELAWRADRAADAGLRLAFEPHVESITESVDDTLDLCKRAPGLTVALDYSHLVFHGISQAEIERLHPVTGHLHGRQGAPGVLQASSRTGSIDFGRIVRDFVERGFDGFFCLEYCCDAYNDMDRSIPSPRRSAFGTSSFAFAKAFLRSRPTSDSHGTEATQGMTERVGHVWRIKPGRRDDYLRMHATIWPELERLLREAGVTSYTIYLQNDTVFSHMDVEDYDRLVERVNGDPISERWEAQFTDILEYPNADPHNGWPERLTEVWHL